MMRLAKIFMRDMHCCQWWKVLILQIPVILWEKLIAEDNGTEGDSDQNKRNCGMSSTFLHHLKPL